MDNSRAPLRVCIDARLPAGIAGGIEQVVLGLASGLSGLEDGTEEYLFLTQPGANDWLQPYLGGRCRLLEVRPSSRRGRLWGRVKARIRSHAGAVRLARRARLRLQSARPWQPQESDGTIEAAGVDIMHFTNQGAFCTSISSIYHPHDLQHLHLPQFFSEEERAGRERAYREFCRQAAMVAVSSDWVRRDVIQQYALPEEKVRTVPLAPPTATLPHPTAQVVADIRRRYSLPESFIYYPAQTWPHKNHLALLEALALIRDRDRIRIPLVCSGRQQEFFPAIRERVSRLRLEDQVRFLGFVDAGHVQCLYQLCRAVVIPTLFEAGSFPLLEAFLAGRASACSDVTSLPELAGDAALIFDPHDTPAIARAIERLWNDEALRSTLGRRGAERAAQYSWDKTARTFRAHYRRLAGLRLDEEDRALIGENGYA